jgi:hypothetical protein
MLFEIMKTEHGRIYIMNKRVMAYIFVFLSFSLLSNVVLAKEPVMNTALQNNAGENEICSAVKKSIREGMNAKDVVQTGIKLGHNACLIVKCAIEGGGNLRDIVTGAIEAGAPSHVVSRCAIDAGVEADELTAYIMSAAAPGFCYFEPEVLAPIEIELPGGDPGGGFLSPSSPSSF